MPKVNDKPSVFLGIDPGVSGGLAVLYPEREGKPVASAMPVTERDILDWLRNCSPGLPTFATLEQVNGYQGNGHPGSHMFNFGKSYGGLRMALIAAEIPFETVAPAKWQRTLGIPPRKKDEGRTAWKNRLKAKAQELFPSVRVTLATADALLIAEYNRRTRG